MALCDYCNEPIPSETITFEDSWGSHSYERRSATSLRLATRTCNTKSVLSFTALYCNGCANVLRDILVEKGFLQEKHVNVNGVRQNETAPWTYR